MEKKELKFYEAPACEVVELKMQGILCASGDNDPENVDGEGMGGNDEEGYER